MADMGDEQGGKAYALYSSLRRFFEPLREHWEKLTPRSGRSSSRKWKAFELRPTADITADGIFTEAPCRRARQRGSPSA